MPLDGMASEVQHLGRVAVMNLGTGGSPLHLTPESVTGDVGVLRQDTSFFQSQVSPLQAWGSHWIHFTVETGSYVGVTPVHFLVESCLYGGATVISIFAWPVRKLGFRESKYFA